jgi:glycosyltransferase involved in cell wall biosynthesis
MTGGAGPGVSFVITVYNKRAYLPAMVAGLTAQRGDFPREFIFVDDGSTDGSRQMLERLTAGWPATHILGQANLGPSRATNRGLAATQYPLIKLVDGDDLLLPDAAAQLREAMLHDSAAVLGYGAIGEYDAAQPTITPAPAAPAPAAARRVAALAPLLRNCDFAPSACMVRRDAIQRSGGCDERVFVQDYSLFLRLAAAGPFVRLDAPVVVMPHGQRPRLNDGGPQVLHDLNLALFHFLSEHPVAGRLRRRAVRHGVRRARKWARRQEQAAFVGPTLWALLQSYAAPRDRALALLLQSCAAFTTSRPVRRL